MYGARVLVYIHVRVLHTRASAGVHTSAHKMTHRMISTPESDIRTVCVCVCVRACVRVLVREHNDGTYTMMTYTESRGVCLRV